MNFVKTEFTDKVLSHFDKATYLDEGVFLDRFGCKVYTEFLSTSSKALICLGMNPDKVINFMEVDDGAGDLFITKDAGSIFVSLNRLTALLKSREDKSIDVSIDGKRFYRYLDLVEYVEELV